MVKKAKLPLAIETQEVVRLVLIFSLTFFFGLAFKNTDRQ